MGYMGFGLQRWIYTQKPRKPYKFGNRSAEDTQIFHDNKNYNDISKGRKVRLEKTSETYKLNKYLASLLLIVICLIASIITLYFVLQFS